MKVRDKINEISKDLKVNFLGVDFDLIPTDFMRIKDEKDERIYTYSCEVKDFGKIPDNILDLEYLDFKVWKIRFIKWGFLS